MKRGRTTAVPIAVAVAGLMLLAPTAGTAAPAPTPSAASAVVLPAAARLVLPDRAAVKADLADLPDWPARVVRHVVHGAGRAPVEAGWPGDPGSRDYLTVTLDVVTGTGTVEAGTAAPLGLTLAVDLVDCPYGQTCRAPQPVVRVADPAAALAAVQVVSDDDGYRLRGSIPADLLVLTDTDSGAAPTLDHGLALDVDMPSSAPLHATDVRSSGALLRRDVNGSTLSWGGGTLTYDQPRGGVVTVDVLTVALSTTRNHNWSDEVSRPGRLQPLKGSAAAAALDTALAAAPYATAEFQGVLRVDGVLRSGGVVLPGNRHEAETSAWVPFVRGSWPGGTNISAGANVQHWSCADAQTCTPLDSQPQAARSITGGHAPGEVSVDLLAGDGTVWLPARLAVRPVQALPTIMERFGPVGEDGKATWGLSVRLDVPQGRWRGSLGGRKATVGGDTSLVVIASLDTWRAAVGRS